MRIVVTGSESFVGREFISRCLAHDDIRVSGFDLADKKSQDYEFNKGDIRSPSAAELIPEGADAIVHLAALSRDEDCKNRAYECFETNVLGTLNVMRCAARKNIKQFIFASSEWVYGAFEDNEEKDEEAAIDIGKLASEYALSKLVSEANLRQTFLRGFCATTILRFGIIYGPRPTPGSAVESLANDVKRKSEVVVGSLKSGRRFVHVTDIARGVIQSVGIPGFNIINLVGDRIITLGEIIGESEKILGKKVKISESTPNEASVRNPSNKKAKELLRWEPKVGLMEGLKTLLGSI